MIRVLIIEDNLEIRENTSEILQLKGYEVITSDNGRDGIAAVLRESPDVILCDIMMPDVNGYQVIRELRANPLSEKIPFIYVTASGEKSEVKMAMELGANGYVRKPYDVKELIEAIQKVLAME